MPGVNLIGTCAAEWDNAFPIEETTPLRLLVRAAGMYLVREEPAAPFNGSIDKISFDSEWSYEFTRVVRPRNAVNESGEYPSFPDSTKFWLTQENCCCPCRMGLRALGLDALGASHPSETDITIVQQLDWNREVTTLFHAGGSSDPALSQGESSVGLTIDLNPGSGHRPCRAEDDTLPAPVTLSFSLDTNGLFNVIKALGPDTAWEDNLKFGFLVIEGGRDGPTEEEVSEEVYPYVNGLDIPINGCARGFFVKGAAQWIATETYHTDPGTGFSADCDVTLEIEVQLGTEAKGGASTGTGGGGGTGSVTPGNPLEGGGSLQTGGLEPATGLQMGGLQTGTLEPSSGLDTGSLQPGTGLEPGSLQPSNSLPSSNLQPASGLTASGGLESGGLDTSSL